MKKGNRRLKRSSTVDSSSPAKDDDKQQQQQQDYEKRVHDLEKENEALKREIEELKDKMGNVSSPTSVANSVQKLKQDDLQKLHLLEEQVMELKKKLIVHSQYSKQKHKMGDAGSLDCIRKLKAQKVQLLCKIKLDSVQFRLTKASLEREVLQTKKEQRRNEYEMRKLLALNQRQKLVLQRKTEEASMATKRLKVLLESRKASYHRTSGAKSGNSAGSQGVEVELKVAERVEEIRSEYQRQMEEMADEVRKYEEEAEMLRQENFRFLLQDREVDCAVRDEELRDLKEEVTRLSDLVSQLGMAKMQVNITNRQVNVVQPSCSIGSSVEPLRIDTSESEWSGGNIGVMGKSASGTCCSCSKKSLCKTTKCECRAAGDCCGIRCGCVASKCTNNKVLSKSDESPQSEVLQNLHVSGASGTGKCVFTSRPSELNNDCKPQRKPLREIGNTQINPSPTKPGRKTRKQKSVMQLDTTVPASLLPENTEGPRKEADIPLKLTRAATRSAVTKNIPQQ